MRILYRCTLVVALFSITVAPTLLAQPQTTPLPRPTIRSAQEVLLLFAGQSPNNRIVLILNNNRPADMEVSPTLYALDGNAITLPKINLAASESRMVELSQSLKDANVYFPLGYLKLAYVGSVLELGSQLTLYPIEDHGGLDSARSLKTDFVGTGRHAVAWMPEDARAVVALTNTTSSPITAVLSINGLDELVYLSPNQTKLRSTRADQVLERRSIPFSCDVSYNGAADAVRVFGYVESRRDGNLPLRFYDPKGSTTKTLVAVGLKSNQETHLSVKNLSLAPITVIPHLSEVGSQTPRTFEGRPVVIPARQSRVVVLDSSQQQLVHERIERFTLTVKTDANVGSLVASVTQRVAVGLLEDVPLRTGNPIRLTGGAYPLRWDQDYENRPMIGNYSDQTIKVRAYVIAAGVTYTFPMLPVSPDATLDFNIDAMRRNQTPDINGKVIPLSAKFGKFHWSPEPGLTKVALAGRTELLSLENKRASSFSCNMECSPRYVI